jgi:hypothetical protein
MSAYRVMQAAAFAAMIVFVASAAFAQAPTAACQKDLADNDVRFKQTIQQLEAVKNGTPAQKCAAYRSHVQIMKQSIPVFQRCTSGLGQRENIGQMNDSIADFEQLIKAKC